MATESKPGTEDELQELLRTENDGPIERLTILLQETEQQHHGRPAADWPRWYAAFICERQLGASVEGAQVFADQYTIAQSDSAEAAQPMAIEPASVERQGGHD
jgi:hypothetical protein